MEFYSISGETKTNLIIGDFSELAEVTHETNFHAETKKLLF